MINLDFVLIKGRNIPAPRLAINELHPVLNHCDRVQCFVIPVRFIIVCFIVNICGCYFCRHMSFVIMLLNIFGMIHFRRDNIACTQDIFRECQAQITGMIFISQKICCIRILIYQIMIDVNRKRLCFRVIFLFGKRNQNPILHN